MATYRYARPAAGRVGPLHPVHELEPAAPAAFPQTPGALDWLLGPALQQMPHEQDAFHVSVYAPADAQDLPAMVFLPGGAFISGAGTVRWYDAQNFADAQRCVVFVPNYRLGLAAHRGRVGAGNTVLDELLLALHWVQRNAGHFGADAQRVTLAGQSAGAFWAFALAQLPAARGLFTRLYLGSLSWQPPMDQAQAAERQQIVDRHLAGGEIDTAPLDLLLQTQGEIARAWAGRGLGLYPSADDAVTADLFDARAAAARLHVDEVLLSSTADEAAAFLGPVPVAAFNDTALAGFVDAHFHEPAAALERLQAQRPNGSAKDLMIRAMTLHQIELYAAELGDALASAGKTVSYFRLDVPSPLPGAGAAHCFDLPFLFGNPEQWQDAPMLKGIDPADFRTASAGFSTAVGSFLHEGRAGDAHGKPLLAHSAAARQFNRLTSSGFEIAELEDGFTTRRATVVRS